MRMASEGSWSIREVVMSTVNASIPASREFVRRPAPDGAVLLVCPTCFRIIARGNETDLASHEKTHLCTSDDLSLQARYGPF